MDRSLFFVVPDSCNGMNAQQFLRYECNLSARMITRLKRENNGILMDGKILRTVDDVIAGKTVVINPPVESSMIEAVEGTLDIAFEDEHFLIVNKPPFMPVHPVKQHQSDTLANLVTYYMQSKGESYVFRAINRLDRDTSGLVIIAKNRFIANAMKGKIDKIYFALCHGKLEDNGTVNAPIGLTSESKMVRYVIPQGQPAITHYTVVNSNDEFSFIKLILETGRTHQIRCHMTSLGHPLLGDDLYGGSREKISRQALHCGQIDFVHPITNEKLKVIANLPQDMSLLINE
ncbi:MAG: RluA family pseudouridine synthase [Ruminococcus sp.]|nr:RluA family pseudouridine synthase [Ruminococcus sp.]